MAIYRAHFRFRVEEDIGVKLWILGVDGVRRVEEVLKRCPWPNGEVMVVLEVAKRVLMALLVHLIY